MDVQNLPVVTAPDAEVAVRAWEERCAVSHAGHFRPIRPAALAFVRPHKPVHEMRVMVASSGGVYAVDQQPFDLESHAGDDTVRWIPASTDDRDLRFADDHYDHTDADADPNCMFPLGRLRELAAEGAIGSVATHHLGFMGFVPDPRRWVDDVVPAVVDRLRGDGVDAVIFGPGCPMCHRTVALAQNLVEAAGVPTVSITLATSLTLGFGVPRALHARFPFGNTFGEAGDRWTQRAILKALLAWLHQAPSANSVRRLPYSWSTKAVPEDKEDCVDGACFVPRPTSRSASSSDSREQLEAAGRSRSGVGIAE